MFQPKPRRTVAISARHLSKSGTDCPTSIVNKNVCITESKTPAYGLAAVRRPSAQKAKGEIKKVVGKLVGSKTLEGKGRVQKRLGKARLETEAWLPGATAAPAR